MTTTAPRKMPAIQHQALLTAARRPDQLVPGRDDADVYWSGGTWFRAGTLRRINVAGYADIRPMPWNDDTTTWEQTHQPLYLTPAGRAYARHHGVTVSRRRIVLVACGSKKLAHPGLNEYGNLKAGYPAGELYTGAYHRSLRHAADTLTDQTLIRIVSARHGLVSLSEPLLPYDTRIGDADAITTERLARQTAALALDDADVIFLGGQQYATLLRPSVPHLFTPLSGGIGVHRHLCKQASEQAGLREAWWQLASHLHTRNHP